MRPASTADAGQKGSITVYASLIVLLVTALLGAMLESAHVSAVRGNVKAAAAAGLDSLFSMYDQDLFDQYGLLFLNEELLENETELEVYKQLLRSEQPGRIIIGSTPSMLSFELKDVELINKYYAVDDDGAFFFREVTDLMRYQETAELLALFTRYLTQIENAESAYKYVIEKNDSYKDEDWGKLAEEAAKDEAQKDPDSEPEEKPAFTNSDVDTSLNGSILTQVEDIISEGLLNIFLEDTQELSDTIREISIQPGSDHGIEESSGLLEKGAEALLFDEYVMSYMGDYLSPSKAGGFEYETEFIINGAASDKANLLGVLTQILLIRMGFNIVFLLSNKAVGGQALAMSQLLVGWTGFVPLIETVRLMIVAVWAFCESILDVRAIISGETPPFFKSEASWTTDITDCVAQVLTGERARSQEGGMSYRTYLRILLFMCPKKERVINTMKEITLVLNGSRRNGFSFGSCVYGIEMDISTEVRPVFSSMYGAFRNDGGWEIKESWSQTY